MGTNPFYDCMGCDFCHREGAGRGETGSGRTPDNAESGAEYGMDAAVHRGWERKRDHPSADADRALDKFYKIIIL